MCQTTSTFSAKAARQELESKGFGNGDDGLEDPPPTGWVDLYVWQVICVCVLYHVLIALY